jgi:hypothetical protein
MPQRLSDFRLSVETGVLCYMLNGFTFPLKARLSYQCFFVSRLVKIPVGPAAARSGACFEGVSGPDTVLAYQVDDRLTASKEVRQSLVNG